MLHAEQALLREQLSKRIIEVIPSQEVVPLQDPLKEQFRIKNYS
jgi:hypothetical protein